MFKLALFNWIVKRFFGSGIDKLVMSVHPDRNCEGHFTVKIYSRHRERETARIHVYCAGSGNVFEIEKIAFQK